MITFQGDPVGQKSTEHFLWSVKFEKSFQWIFALRGHIEKLSAIQHGFIGNFTLYKLHSIHPKLVENEYKLDQLISTQNGLRTLTVCFLDGAQSQRYGRWRVVDGFGGRQRALNADRPSFDRFAILRRRRLLDHVHLQFG